MKKLTFLTFSTLLFFTASILAQEQNTDKKGHYNISKFRQLYEELPTPNMFRTEWMQGYPIGWTEIEL